MASLTDQRVGVLDWAALQDGLDERGVACARGLLRADECAAIENLYASMFSSRNNAMSWRHR